MIKTVLLCNKIKKKFLFVKSFRLLAFGLLLHNELWPLSRGVDTGCGDYKCSKRTKYSLKNHIKSVLYPFLSSLRLAFQMSRLRRVLRQMMGYLGTLSLGIITFYKTSDNNVLRILSGSEVLVEGRCHLLGSLSCFSRAMKWSNNCLITVFCLGHHHYGS